MPLTDILFSDEDTQNAFIVEVESTTPTTNQLSDISLGTTYGMIVEIAKVYPIIGVSE